MHVFIVEIFRCHIIKQAIMTQLKKNVTKKQELRELENQSKALLD